MSKISFEDVSRARVRVVGLDTDVSVGRVRQHGAVGAPVEDDGDAEDGNESPQRLRKGAGAALVDFSEFGSDVKPLKPCRKRAKTQQARRSAQEVLLALEAENPSREAAPVSVCAPELEAIISTEDMAHLESLLQEQGQWERGLQGAEEQAGQDAVEFAERLQRMPSSSSNAPVSGDSRVAEDIQTVVCSSFSKLWF